MGTKRTVTVTYSKEGFVNRHKARGYKEAGRFADAMLALGYEIDSITIHPVAKIVKGVA